MKGRNVTVKEIIKPFFCTIVKRSRFHYYRTLVSLLVSMVIAFLRSNRDSNSIFIIFYLNLTIWLSANYRGWVRIFDFFSTSKKRNK